tara:strand:+ start:1073 stop:3418 length:2346 start_codon:yes stop_codon:yes gene_type:complete
MRNKFYIIVLISFFSVINSHAEELNISSTEINYNKKLGLFELNKNIVILDSNNNKIEAEEAIYNKSQELVKTIGFTKIYTNEGYILEGSDINFESKKNNISSSSPAKIVDLDKNVIKLTTFNYLTDKKFFRSRGSIDITDSNNNYYNLSEVFIDVKKKKIIGTDVKAFLNQEEIKVNNQNEPRFFANTLSIDEDKSTFNKAVCTYCKDKGEDTSPAWSLRAKKIEHVKSKKTIYYDSAILRIYDFPIFYFPKFAHPDPTVKRRSGFLNPKFLNSSRLGSGITMPYYWAIAENKDLTFTPNIYGGIDPLVLTEYRHEFKNSSLLVDFGFAKENYEKSKTDSKGARSHFFSSLKSILIDDDDKFSDLNIEIQQVTNDKYLKAFDIDTELASKEIDVLHNLINFSYSEDDFILDANINVFEDLRDQVSGDKYEFLSSLNVDKQSLFQNNHGNLDFNAIAQYKVFETNKQNELLVNNFEWKSRNFINQYGFKSNVLGLIKNSNYNAKNVNNYKSDGFKSELAGTLGYYSELPLVKKNKDKLNKISSLTPKFLFKYSPNPMRKIDDGRLTYLNLYEMNRLNDLTTIESGLSLTYGFEYKNYTSTKDNIFNKENYSFSIGQVLNEKSNKDLPSSMSLNQEFSDIVGESSISVTNNSKLSYKFAIDQNLEEAHYNEIDASLLLNDLKFNLGYLQEKNHIGNQEYIISSINYDMSDNNKISFDTKRNILNNSTSYYNLSYEYMYDCLKAGLVYRREFYEDNDLDPKESLMFQISLVPFAEFSTPTLTNK